VPVESFRLNDLESNRLAGYSSFTGPICARAFTVQILHKLNSHGHHDWPVKRCYRKEESSPVAGPIVPLFRIRFGQFAGSSTLHYRRVNFVKRLRYPRGLVQCMFVELKRYQP